MGKRGEMRVEERIKKKGNEERKEVGRKDTRKYCSLSNKKERMTVARK